MDNTYCLHPGDVVNVVDKIYKTKVDTFDLQVEEKSVMIEYLKKNKNKNLIVDRVFGNLILLTDGQCVFDCYITPKTDNKITSLSDRNKVCLRIENIPNISNCFKGFGYSYMDDVLFVPANKNLDNKFLEFKTNCYSEMKIQESIILSILKEGM